MMTLRSLFVLGLALSLMGSAEAAKAKAKKKEHAHHGVVEVVKLDKDKESDKGKDIGSITIKVHAKKKKGVEAKQEKFQLAGDTKVERVAGKKGSKTTETATLASLKPGEHVVVLAKNGEAKEIKIVAKKKRKKKKANA